MFRSTLALLALSSFSLFAQVNFVSPPNMAHGSTLPATCAVGDMYQLTSATSSAQVYVCSAANTWSQQTGTGGGGSSSFGTLTSGTNTSALMTVGVGSSLIANGGTLSANQINLGTIPASQPCVGTNSTSQFIAGTCSGGGTGTANVPTATFSSATATFFAACSSSAPCPVSKGGTQVDQIQATNTLTAPGSGAGAVYVYWTTTGPVVGSPGGVTITIGGSGPLVGTNVQGITAFPSSATALIATLQYSSAAWTSVTNYQPNSSNPPQIQAGAGIASTFSGGTQSLAIDTGAASVGIGTQNYVPRWVGNGYTLGVSLFYDNGTKTGVGGVPDDGYIFQVNSTNTGTIYTGIANHDATNAGSSSFCQVVNGAASATCITEFGSAAVGGPAWQVAGNGDFSFTATSGSAERFRVYNAGGVKVPAQALASLGTCNAGKEGTIGRANDLTNAITWGTTAAGGGTSHAMLVCNGTNWVVMGQ